MMKKLSVTCMVVFLFGSSALAGIALVPKSPTAVQYYKIQCIEFFAEWAQKKICVYPGNEENEISQTMKDFELGFWQILTYKAEDVPTTSWLEITSFPEIPRTFVRLSDGKYIYASGKGNSFLSAWEDLGKNFLKEQ